MVLIQLYDIINLQKRAVRSIVCAKPAAHTDPIFKKLNILKVEDLISLNQTLFIHKYRAGRLPSSFNNFFSNIISNSTSTTIKDSDFNFKHNIINQDNLCYLPHYQIVKSWNCTSTSIKCQGEENQFKLDYINVKISLYETECYKRNCYSCK